MTIANAEMAKAWDGDEGAHWTEFASRYDAAAAGYWLNFLASGHVRPSDRVLDIGCGTGESVVDMAATASSVVGVDLSAQMLELAGERCRQSGRTNAELVQGDAQVQPFATASFDLVVSRFGAMFFGDPVAAFTNIAAATKASGRLALLAWQGLGENEWLTVIRNALAAGRDLPAPEPGHPGPFGLADPAGVTRILEAAGFGDIHIEGQHEPIRFGSDAEDAWSFMQHIGMVKGLSHGLEEAAREDAIAKLRTELEAHASADGVTFGSAAWLITATRP